jgi:shikimate dehydrogenase
MVIFHKNSMQERLLGLVGYPLSHSLSKLYFEEKFRLEKISGWKYEILPLKKISDLPALLKEHPDLAGFNVTIPHKISIIPLLYKLDEVAEKIGAVNTVRVEGKGKTRKLLGYNTDCDGFEKALLPRLTPEHKHALILGTGGSARAVAFVFDKLKIDWKMVSRQPQCNELGYHELDEKTLKHYHLIINCSPVGMSPDLQQSPDIPYRYLDEKHLLFDLVYNPPLTRFLRNGRQKGATTINGMEMLKKQAEKAWEIWTKDF